MAGEGIIRDPADLVEPDALANLVSYRIRLLQTAAYKVFEQRIPAHGSAPRYFGLLKLVEANPGVSQTKLAEGIYLDRSSLVPILDTLTREGWIERRRTTQDKRVRRVFMTPAGITKLKALEVEIQRHEEMMTMGLTASEKVDFLRLLRRVDANLRAAYGNMG